MVTEALELPLTTQQQALVVEHLGLVDAAVADEGAIAMDSPAVAAYMKKLRASWLQAELARLQAELARG